jgi:hypothetical protein
MKQNFGTKVREKAESHYRGQKLMKTTAYNMELLEDEISYNVL